VTPETVVRLRNRMRPLEPEETREQVGRGAAESMAGAARTAI
jgi:hypothetical protein